MRYRRAVMIVELVIAMAVLAALATVGAVSYVSYTHRAHTTAAAETLSQIGLLLEAYRSLSPGGAYPTDAVNAVGQPNSGAPSYDALAADLMSLTRTASSASRSDRAGSRPSGRSPETQRPLTATTHAHGRRLRSTPTTMHRLAPL